MHSWTHALVMSTLLSLGCAAQQPVDTLPAALSEASRAMKDKDAQTLHGMMDESLTVGTSVESLAQDLERDEAEFAHLADQIASPSQIVYEATVNLESGKTLELVKEGDTWKLATPIVKSEKPTDPLSVLASFADQLSDLAASLTEADLLASHQEDGFLSVIETVSTELLAVEAKDLVINDDRCYVNLPSGHKIELVRQDDQWKIYSIFPAIEFR